jgi:hypothetical protein
LEDVSLAHELSHPTLDRTKRRQFPASLCRLSQTQVSVKEISGQLAFYPAKRLATGSLLPYTIRANSSLKLSRSSQSKINV